MTTPNNKKILVIFGTRPEAIKMAPIIKKLLLVDGITTKVCVTAQHRGMLDQVLDFFDIHPDFDLNLMKAGQTLAELTSKVLEGVSNVLLEWKPDLVLVHGDTTTTLAASLAAYYQKVSVGHVEAGLRTRDIYSPWPEEVNRRFVANIAMIHFAPTQASKVNLLKEGISDEAIKVTGNTVIDSLLNAVKTLNINVQLNNDLKHRFSYIDQNKKLILVTGHRRENFGPAFENICQAIKDISERDDVQVVYPVHLNPNVQEPVMRILGGIENIYLIDPLEYLSFVFLMNNAYMILTDSGGVQEEAPSLNKPVLVFRETTERPEAILNGAVKLVGTKRDAIFLEASRLLDNPEEYNKMINRENPYGDGLASERIVNYIKGLK